MARKLGYMVGNTNGARDFSGRAPAAGGAYPTKMMLLGVGLYLCLALIIGLVYG